MLLEVDIDTRGGAFKASRPRQVLDGLPSLTSDPDYDVLGSDTFLVIEPVGNENAPRGVTVVVNWLDDLRRRVPN